MCFVISYLQFRGSMSFPRPLWQNSWWLIKIDISWWVIKKFSWVVSLCDCQKSWLLSLWGTVDVDVYIFTRSLKAHLIHICTLTIGQKTTCNVNMVTHGNGLKEANWSALASFNSLFWFLWFTSLWFRFSLTALVSLVFIWSSQEKKHQT